MGISGEPPKVVLGETSVRIASEAIESMFSAAVDEARVVAARAKTEGLSSSMAGVANLAELEVALVARRLLLERISQLVADARTDPYGIGATATWQEIASVTGHASRGAAAKHFKGALGS